jgi:hypothetical protein
MSYGIIEYDENGNPICEICKKSFKRVLSHVRQKHFVSEKEYKLTFGFDLHKGICSEDSAELSRNATLANYDKCIGKNLLANGSKTRFTKGHEGRTGDKIQEQTRLRFIERLKDPKMKAAMFKSGQKVGKSGLGNKTRWNKIN